MKQILLYVFLFVNASALAQSFLDSTVVVSSPKDAAVFFQELEGKYRVRFFYLDDWVRFTAVDPRDSGRTIKDILDRIAADAGLSYERFFDYAIVFTKDVRHAREREQLLYRASAARIHIQVVALGSRDADFRPGKRIVIEGAVRSEVDGEPLPNAIVHLDDLDQGTTTDEHGVYRLNIPAGDHVIRFSANNFADRVIDLRGYADGTVDVILEDAPVMLQEIEVSDKAMVTGRAGQSSLIIKNLKRGPAFLGESDIIKNLQIQAGVTSVGEISAGFNVRGGGSDQNLVLYDGVPVINTSHALGFFSGFNPEAITSVNFYRGGIPAEYGGRVSSVLNITSREGDFKKWRGSGGIGIISSNLTVGGPIRRDTASLFASFRSSYSNWMLRQVRSNYAEVGKSSLAFMDGSLKLTHRINQKTKMLLSAYGSEDEFSLTNDTLYRWRNLAASMRIDRAFSDRLFFTFMAGLGTYQYEFEEPDPDKAFVMKYGMTYPSLKLDFNYNGKHSLSFGLQSTLYNFTPGHMRPMSASSSQADIIIPDERSFENALYAADEVYIKENFALEIGIRYSLYTRVGAATIYRYKAGETMDAWNVSDSTVYGRGEIVNSYHGAEPRISFRYVFSPAASLKFGYNRVFQYVHLITNTAAITPVDIWQSSNPHFRPQVADQISLGYYRTINDNTYEGFVEGYYKNISNILEFKDGSRLILNRKIETALLPGRAVAYGVEISGSKVKGRLQGLMNYTFSRSLRKVNGNDDSEKINNGEYYASNFDQPHVVNLNWRYGISRRHFFSGNFTYHTGRPTSIPRAGYIIDKNVISDFSERNRFRIPDYHRLDIALIIEGNHKRKKLLDGTWTISLYNVYARRNAYSVYYDKDERSNKLVPYKLSVVGTVIPSVSYGFKF